MQSELSAVLRVPAALQVLSKKKEMWFKGRVAVSDVARHYCHLCAASLPASSSCSSCALFSDT